MNDVLRLGVPPRADRGAARSWAALAIRLTAPVWRRSVYGTYRKEESGWR